MDEKMIRSMKKDERDLAACTEKLEQARQLFRAGREEEAGEILQAIAILGNELTIRHRQMVMDTGDPNARADVERIIAEIHPVEIGFTPEGWFGLRMEPLARTRDTASKEYIRGIIYPAMRRFFADKATVRYPRCTLIFRHVYDRNTPAAQHRDYNNAEVKLVTDTVAMYVMVDDDPLHCNVFHCSAPGPESRTEVYVVPREDFAAWFAMEPAFPDEGVRRRVSEYIKKSGLPLNRTGSGETEAVCPNCGQTAAVKKIPLEEHFEFWKCASCGAEGDAVQYAMHHLRTASEDEALLDVCKKLGVAIPILPTITAKELMEKEFPPRVELIEGMLGPGLYILAGAPKIGKSWLVLQIAHHISTGTPLWDRRVSRHAVLYLCLEDTLQRIQSRLLTICDGETGDVTFSIEAGILGDGFEGQLIAYLRSHGDTKVVIVDTLAKVRGAVSSSNVYSSDYATMNVFKHLADTFKIALILVHHTRKQDAEDAIQKISGTNGLMGCADGAMVLEKPDRSAPQVILTMTGRDFEDQTFRLRQNRETMCWEITECSAVNPAAPAEPVLAAVAALVQEEVLQNREPELKVWPNTLSRKLRTPQLQKDFGIRLTQSRNQNGKYLELKAMTDMSDGGG